MQFYALGKSGATNTQTFTANADGKAYVFVTARCDSGGYTISINGEQKDYRSTSTTGSFTKTFVYDVKEGDELEVYYKTNSSNHWTAMSVVLP